MSEAPERIWLQSAEDAKHQCEGRMWCEDKVWPENVDQHEPTEYVRADIAASLQEQVETLTKERDQLQKIADSKVISSRNLHTVSAEAAEAERDRWKIEYLNACRDAASFSDDLVKAEAKCDRFAAEVTRLREALERVLNAAGCGVDLYNDEPGREAIRTARTALVSVKE